MKITFDAVHIIATYHKVLIMQKSEFIFLLFNPQWPATLFLLVIGVSLVFLHGYMFKATYTTLINLISTISAIPLNFT
jgi:hypothetical protein